MAALHVRVPIEATTGIEHSGRHLKFFVPENIGTAEISRRKRWCGPHPKNISIVGIHAEQHEVCIGCISSGKVGLSKKNIAIGRGGDEGETGGKNSIGIAKNK